MTVVPRLNWHFQKITEAPVLRLDWEGSVKAEGSARVGRLSKYGSQRWSPMIKEGSWRTGLRRTERVQTGEV